MIPPPQKLLSFSPTWAATASGQWQPVTLMMALEGTNASRRPGMIAEHRDVLASFVQVGNQVLASTPWDGPQRPPLGFHLLVFAAELASALNACADEAQRRSCTETVSAATLVAAACLGAVAASHEHGE